jgi:hypothetical protein
VSGSVVLIFRAASAAGSGGFGLRPASRRVLGFPGGSPGEVGPIGELLVGLLVLQLLLAAAQSLSARARISQLGRQLVASRLAKPLVLVGVRLCGLAEYLFDLDTDRGVAARRPP